MLFVILRRFDCSTHVHGTTSCVDAGSHTYFCLYRSQVLYSANALGHGTLCTIWRTRTVLRSFSYASCGSSFLQQAADKMKCSPSPINHQPCSSITGHLSRTMRSATKVYEVTSSESPSGIPKHPAHEKRQPVADAAAGQTGSTIRPSPATQFVLGL